MAKAEGLEKKRSRLLFGVFLFIPGLVWAELSIEWADVVIPPFHQTSEPGISGMTEDIIALMQSQLPEIEQSVQIFPIARLLEEMRQKKNACNPGVKWTPERTQYLYFSKPSIFAPANGVALRRDAGIELPKRVSLVSILEQEQRVGVEAARAYGEPIDGILTRYRDTPQMYQRFSSNNYGAMLEMLLRERLDYVIGYPMEFIYASRNLSQQGVLTFLPLQEASPYTRSHIACSRTQQGKRLIERFNQVLEEWRPRPAYRQIMEKWLPQSILPEFREAYDREFLTDRNWEGSD